MSENFRKVGHRGKSQALPPPILQLPEEGLLRVEEARQFLRISRPRFRQLVASGALRVRTLGAGSRLQFVTCDDLRNFIRDLEVTS